MKPSTAAAAACQSVSIVAWTQHSTDPSKLRSLILNPSKYPSACLYEECVQASTQNGSYAYMQETTASSTRCTVFGNLSYPGGPDYAHAARQILANCTTNVLKFSALPGAALPAMQEVLAQQGYMLTYNSPCWQYVLTEATADQLQQQSIQLPGNFQLSRLQEADAEMVNSLWTYRNSDSLAVIRELITTAHTSCIRVQPNQTPVCWALEMEPGCFGALHTLQPYRRAGLARAVMSDLLCQLHKQHKQQDLQLQQQPQRWQHIKNGSNRQRTDIGSNWDASADAVVTVPSKPSIVTATGGANACSDGLGWPGGHVYGYVLYGNEASIALMESVGLQCTGTYIWAGFEKPS